MLEGFKFDLNSIGFFFWFILLGLLTIVFSIIYNPEYIFLGASLSLYGMIGFLTDLLFDRIWGRVLKKNFTKESMHEISIFGHVIRFTVQVGIIIGLIILVNSKYCFI